MFTSTDKTIQGLRTISGAQPSVSQAEASQLTSLSAQELKTFVTCRVKLQLRLDKGQDNVGFAAKSFGAVSVSGQCRLILFPGGKFLLAIGYFGQLALHRIELDNGAPNSVDVLFGRSSCPPRHRPPQCSFSTKYPGKTSPLPSHLLILPSGVIPPRTQRSADLEHRLT